MPRMSDRPMRVVSRAALPGTQARLPRSAGPPEAWLPSALAAGTLARSEGPASSLSLISAAFLSGHRARWVSVVIAPPRVLRSRYLPRVSTGPAQGDGVGDHYRKYR